MTSTTRPSTPFRIVPIALLAQGGRWRVEAMRGYSAPVLLWFTRGKGRITVAGQTRGYGPHNLVYIPPKVMHGFDMVGQVYGTALFLPRDMDNVGLPETPLHLRLVDAGLQAEVTAQIDNMQRELESGRAGSDRALEHMTGLFSVWLQRQLDEGNARDERSGTSADRLAAAYTNLIEEHFRTDQGVAEYAAKLNVTPTHLTRACNVACGRPALQLLQDRRHYEARRLLSETRLPIKEVASALGFSSAAYFSRAFQAQTGRTPSSFRKNP